MKPDVYDINGKHRVRVWSTPTEFLHYSPEAARAIGAAILAAADEAESKDLAVSTSKTVPR